MDIYARFLNVLAETITPEYWSRTELLHYLKLAQETFVYDTNFLLKSKKLSHALRNRFNTGTIPNIDIENNIYEVPTDCLNLLAVKWKGESVGQKTIFYIESAYAGGGSNRSEIKGIGRQFTDNWRNLKGNPEHWIAESGGIRFVPFDEEQPFKISTMLSDEEIENIDEYSLLLPEQITSESSFYISNRYTNTWKRLNILEDFMFTDNEMFLSDKIKQRIKDEFNENNYNSSILVIQESEYATAEYIYIPSFLDMKPISGEDKVEIEIPEQYHETIICYASYLALSKEGEKQQDLEKANVYLLRYNEGVKKCKIGKPEIDFDPYNSLPFKL